MGAGLLGGNVEIANGSKFGGNVLIAKNASAGNTNTIQLGNEYTETTINGVLIGKDGCIAGRINYETFAVSRTLPTNVNLNYLGVFTGPSTGQTITIPNTGYNVGQIIRIKNSANIDVFITTGTVPTVLYSVILTATTYTLRRRDTMNLIFQVLVGFN